MLYNSILAPKLAGVSSRELLASKTLLGALLRIGLGHSTPAVELQRSRTLRSRMEGLRYDAVLEIQALPQAAVAPPAALSPTGEGEEVLPSTEGRVAPLR